MPKPKIYFADLTHTAQGISSPSFPLGISFVVSYAKQHLGHEYDFKLFKFPADLARAIQDEPPLLLCLSNYSWNFAMGYKLASLAKARDPKLVVVMGGPNFPIVGDEKIQFFKRWHNVDFYVELEGELGFAHLLEQLSSYHFDVKKFKKERVATKNTSYLVGDELVCGGVERIHDVNVIPSPYLTGVLDQFFDDRLIPMIETTRGCPFSCTFCADGLQIKSKIHRFDKERTREELYYIAERVKNVDELIITDLNFAMYREDVETAKVIAEIKNKYNYPVLVGASAGKNKPKTTIDVAAILEGSWALGAAIQSTDTEVLKAIKRSNISSEAYKELIDFGNKMKTGKTYTEIILGLPGDSKEKHFECLRFGVDNDVNNVRMYQAMLLVGTDMATHASREQYGYITKFRIIPGCIGIYEFFGEKHPVAEIEEIIIGSKTLSVEDYLECRVMNLIVETFHNNAIFDEVFALSKSLGISRFDTLLYIKDHTELYTTKIVEIFNEFKRQTMAPLYDTFDHANNYVLTPEIVERYVGGELGINELLIHRALLFAEFEDITQLIFMAVESILKQQGKLSINIENYLEELKCFILLRKRNILVDVELDTVCNFKYNFEAIQTAGFYINPDEYPESSEPVKLRFFHDDEQKKHIINQIDLYKNTPSGMGRVLQRSNLKLMYRKFEKV